MCWNKKIRDANKRTKKYLDKLKDVWVVCYWARPAMFSVKWSGKYDKEGRPLVWQYNDMNGTCDAYFLKPVTSTTSGFIYGFYFDREEAEAKLTELEEKGNGTLF